MAGSDGVAQVELGFQPVGEPHKAPLQVVVCPLPQNVGPGPGQAIGVIKRLVGGAADEAGRDVPRPRPLARPDAHRNTSASLAIAGNRRSGHATAGASSPMVVVYPPGRAGVGAPERHILRGHIGVHGATATKMDRQGGRAMAARVTLGDRA